MKRYTAIFVVIFMVAVFSGSAVAQDKAMSRHANIHLLVMPESSYHLTAQALRERMESGREDFVLVDVRPRDQYERGHIPGAVNIEAKEIVRPEMLSRLSKEKDIIIYGNTWHEQNKVIIALARLGYKVYTLKNGYYSYISAKSAATASEPLKL